jgi:DNA-binding NtrC family response regulator
MKNKPIRIFIVEDNEVFAMLLKADIENHFNNMTLEIQLFKTGEDSWEKFRTEKPQVVILDYNLNSKISDASDGSEVLVWFKRENPEVKVVLLTSEDSTDIAVQSFRNGAFDYVVKNDAQFKKIHISLFNVFNLVRLENETETYKKIVIGIVLSLAIVLGGMAALKFFPALLGN